MGFGNLKIGSLGRPRGGVLGGRSIPKPRLDDASWLRVLELGKPPLDGPFLRRPSPQTKGAVKEGSQSRHWFGKFLTNNEKGSDRPRNSPQRRDVFSNEWTNLEPHDETHELGLRNLEKGGTIAIVGAGITGLVLAWTLSHARPDVKIKVFDARREVGGWMQSRRGPGNCTWEAGPRTLVPSHVGTHIIVDLLNHMKKLDIISGVRKTAATNRKGLFYGGNLIQLPSSFSEFLSFLKNSPLLFGAKLRVIKDLYLPARPPHVYDESVDSFISRRLGSNISQRIFSALMRGIYGGDVSKLSARSVARLSKLYYLERSERMSIIGAMISGSMKYLDDYSSDALERLFGSLISHSKDAQVDYSRFSILGFPDGIQTLARVIADDLSRRENVSIQLGTKITSLDPCSSGVVIKSNRAEIRSGIVISTTANPALFPSEVSRLLQNISYSSLAVVNVWTPEPIAKDWFGILIPKTEDSDNAEKALGIIFDSSVQRAMQPLLPGMPSIDNSGSSMTVMLGGDLWTDMSEQEATDNALRALKRVLGDFDAGSALVNVSMQKNCIPQPEVGYSKLANTVHERLSTIYDSRLRIAGMALGRGVGVSDCVVDAVTIASRFCEQRKLLYPDFFFPHWQTVTKPESFL